MFNKVVKSLDWNDSKIELETGKIARQADGSVLVRMGGSAVLCTVTFGKELKDGIGFFPLTVHYLEKYYASGKFPGGFLKREAKPSDREALTARLIDRPIRPLFPSDFFNEVNIICHVLSFDKDYPTDVLAIIGASAALKISGAPFHNTLGAIKVGIINDKFVINPSPEQLEESDLDLTMAAIEDSVMMIESSAKEVNRDKLLEAIEFGHNNIKPIIKFIDDFAKDVNKESFQYPKLDCEALYKKVSSDFKGQFEDAYNIASKKLRREKLGEIYKAAIDKYKEEGFAQNVFDMTFKKLQKEIVRKKILDTKLRIDGRKIDEVRNIECETNLFDKTHGSSLFTRGETQSLSFVTLGCAQDAQLRDDVTGVSFDKFLLHYNFPPYSVGEVGMLRPPGRREIGHGKLAHKALLPMIPKEEDFPYTIRVVSEITESNGSSSMATVCAASLALMDTGVPIKNSVAGIAMGLILEKNNRVVLSDISGDEDALGDMDFKVAGTRNGITALQMDIKISGITIDIMKEAVEQANTGFIGILDVMDANIAKPKAELNSSAPRVFTIEINKEKIRDIIGPGGKVIKDICEKSSAKVDIEDSGKVLIFAADKDSLEIAKNMVNDIVAEPEKGKEYKGIVTKTTSFGAFVKYIGNNEGLVHISEIADFRVNNIEDVISEGEEVVVKYLGVDRGKAKLTMKGVKQSDAFYDKDIWKKDTKSDKADSEIVERKRLKSPKIEMAKSKMETKEETKERSVDKNKDDNKDKNKDENKDENKSLINKILENF
ncbi:MAG: polyribonucleotide nucleotidyltransferase [Candidatus Midichloriaceae bacterium]|jgi:polyribonucleotide nucleotidyltransferase